MSTPTTSRRIARSALRGSFAAAVLSLSLVGTAPAQPHGHGPDRNSAELTRIVREATRPYADANVAVADGYLPSFGCVSGPQEGAMGVHFIKGELVADGELDPWKPEALLYDIANGKARLMGVEYIVDAATWLAGNENHPPQLEGQLFQIVGAPNRYGLQPFFELHVWAWQDNPNGTFADWNTKVSCDQR